MPATITKLTATRYAITVNQVSVFCHSLRFALAYCRRLNMQPVIEVTQ